MNAACMSLRPPMLLSIHIIYVRIAQIEHCIIIIIRLDFCQRLIHA